jgi:hypothetical protein
LLQFIISVFADPVYSKHSYSFDFFQFTSADPSSTGVMSNVANSVCSGGRDTQFCIEWFTAATTGMIPYCNFESCHCHSCCLQLTNSLVIVIQCTVCVRGASLESFFKGIGYTFGILGDFRAEAAGAILLPTFLCFESCAA